MSGATGAIYGIQLLEILKRVPEIEALLVIDQAAGQTIAQETNYTVKEVEHLVSVTYRFHRIDAPILSGSFRP